MIVKFVSRQKWLSSYMMLHEIRSILCNMYRFGLGWMWWLGPQHESSRAFEHPPWSAAAGGVDASTADDADRKAVDVWQVEEVELKVKLIPFLELSRDRMLIACLCLIVCVFFNYTKYTNL